MLMTRLRLALIKTVVAKPCITNRDMLPANTGFEKLSSRRAEMPYFELALQRDQRPQPNSSQWMLAFPWDLGEMGRTINFAPLHPTSAGDRMAAKVTEIAASYSAQEIKVDNNPRGFA